MKTTRRRPPSPSRLNLTLPTLLREHKAMGKLTDILRDQGGFDDLENAWNDGIASEDDLIPRGTYTADITQGEAVESRSNGDTGLSSCIRDCRRRL